MKLFPLCVSIWLVCLYVQPSFAHDHASAPTALPSLTVGQIGGPFELVDQDGKKVNQENLKGAPHLLFFGYTNCPDVCPTTLAQMSKFLEAVPGGYVKGIFITVDPERDTPAVLKEYLTHFSPKIEAYTGTRPQVDQVLKAYRVYAKKDPTSQDYAMDHSSLVYLVDKDGKFVTALNLDLPIEKNLQQLRRGM